MTGYDGGENLASPTRSGTITGVLPGSLAMRCGLQTGDALLAINGQPLRDVIDVQIYAAEPELALRYRRAGQEHECQVVRRYGEPLGLEFADSLFTEPPRTCRNRCEFCFVTQMMPGLRSSLYVRDDDYRLSFLHGNYVTLTNLTESDWERIAEQYLSPLYVSVHATEPELRADLLRNPTAARIMEQLEALAELDITLHTQAVLLPGRNDGPHLDRTIRDLAGLYPAVASLAVVPVGLTRRHAPDLRIYTPDEAAAVLAQVQGWQRRLQRELGVPFVHAADEWYLVAGEPLPLAETYGEQLPAFLENGVGMVRQFLDTWSQLSRELARLPMSSPSARQLWVTGTLFAPLLREHAAAFTRETGYTAVVIGVPNRLFGETVTVAGLLTVADIQAALAQAPTGAADQLIVPGELFRGPGGCSLDGQTPAELAHAVGLPVYVAELESAGWQVRLKGG